MTMALVLKQAARDVDDAGAEVEVIEPQALRAEVGRQLAEAARRYSET